MADSPRDRIRASQLAEEATEHYGDFSQVRRLWRYLRPQRGRVAVAVVLSVATSLLMLVPAWAAQVAVDDYIVPGHLDGVVWIALGLMVAQLLLFVGDAYNNYLIAGIGQRAMRDLRTDVFRVLDSQSLAFFDRNPVGRLITRIISDVNVLNELFAQGVVGIFQQLFMLVGILALLFHANWQLACWTMVVVPLVLVCSWNFRNRIRVSYRQTRMRLSRLNGFMQENLTGMKTVQANTKEARQFEHFEALNDLHREAHLKTVFQYSLYFPMIEIIGALGTAIVVWKGGGQFLRQQATIGELMLFITLLERFFWPIKDLSEKYNLVQSAVAASERLFKLLDTLPAIVDPEAPVAPAPLRHSVEFRDVWFAYTPGEWVLKGVSFKVERGQTAAIVGPTGSGKTTLMSLLCRFYEIQKGAILIDGVDIREMRQADLRARIAIVLQDVFLFYGTVRANVRLGRSGIGDERIEEVARAVNAHDFIARLPKGYDSGVKERGATLSVGQKQLLAFARALAGDPEILVLDEATSNIDTQTEALIQAALARLCEGRTAIVIAHRLSTIQRADKILVIHHGHLVEEGTHQQLLALDGLYRRLYELQYRERAA